ncbi:hypothetical protein cand_020190 [Cryptosporidium andersoni]|uniref:Uncharacterized protein n=1 Tax=Cryptosporidium andersoni TaxID=117008 RepID=A0A1J4MWN1_9CRYT|nr:hypothetical protein cand_020190 [Cryptosporidium andersoni]
MVSRRKYRKKSARCSVKENKVLKVGASSLTGNLRRKVKRKQHIKQLLFQDNLLGTTDPDLITTADIARISSKTIDFLHRTGLRQTHICAATGINQAMLSILLKSPLSKNFSISRKCDAIIRLLNYYGRVNEGIISSDPATAPKVIPTKKLSLEAAPSRKSSRIQCSKEKHTIDQFSIAADTLTISSDSNSDEVEKTKCSDYLNGDTVELNQTPLENEVPKVMCSEQKLDSLPLGFQSIPKTLDSIHPTESLSKGGLKNSLEKGETSGCNGEIKSLEYINDAAIFGYISTVYHRYKRNSMPILPLSNKFCGDKGGSITKEIKDLYMNPLLIPLTINLRHYASASNFSENKKGAGASSVLSVFASNPAAFLSSIQGSCYVAERFVWSSNASEELLEAFVENLSRERHLSIFLSNNSKVKALQMLKRELKHAMNMYLEFLYVLSFMDIPLDNNSLLITEVNLNETFDDIIIMDKFKWNISQPTWRLNDYINNLISDLRLPSELSHLLLHSALTQNFNAIKTTIHNFCNSSDVARSTKLSHITVANIKYGGDEEYNNFSSEYTMNNDDAAFRYNKEVIYSSLNAECKFIPCGFFNEWGENADIDMGSDDNPKIYPITEDAEERRQIENRNRFRKRRM